MCFVLSWKWNKRNFGMMRQNQLTSQHSFMKFKLYIGLLFLGGTKYSSMVKKPWENEPRSGRVVILQTQQKWERFLSDLIEVWPGKWLVMN